MAYKRTGTAFCYYQETECVIGGDCYGKDFGNLLFPQGGKLC